MILNQVKMKKTEINTPQIDSDGVSLMIRIGFSLNRDLPVRLLGRMMFLNLRQQWWTEDKEQEKNFTCSLDTIWEGQRSHRKCWELVDDSMRL